VSVGGRPVPRPGARRRRAGDAGPVPDQRAGSALGPARTVPAANGLLLLPTAAGPAAASVDSGRGQLVAIGAAIDGECVDRAGVRGDGRVWFGVVDLLPARPAGAAVTRKAFLVELNEDP